MVTGDMVEDVLEVQAPRRRRRGPQRSIADTLFPGGRQGHLLRDRIGEAKVPVRVVWGREDRILPAAHGQGLPGSVQVTVLDHAGHLAHMEKSKEVNEFVLAGLG